MKIIFEAFVRVQGNGVGSPLITIYSMPLVVSTVPDSLLLTR